MYKVVGIFFALACFSTSALSNSIMGAGMWFWIILATGAFVAVSQFIPILRGPGAGIAGLLSIISVCAVLFGLVAATIGGSFRLETNEALLLFLFFVVAVLGLTLAISFKRSVRREI